jgi:regulator of protease activity HflC (stomatin/prohibitin superfamily)
MGVDQTMDPICSKESKEPTMKKVILYALLLSTGLSSCIIVRQGEVAQKRRLGKLVGEPITERAKLYNPFITTFLMVPIKTINLDVNVEIPSSEGLNIRCEASILYRLESEKVPTILRQIGTTYEEDIISPVFRSAMANVSSRYVAKDMHSGNRAAIEQEVKTLMMKTVSSRGFVIEEVLMKRILLPPTLSSAIEQKLSAEQQAEMMMFVIDRERQEAERQVIQATGVRDAQKILAEGLTKEILRFEAIEAFKQLSRSPNAKTIITSGDTPFIIGGSGDQ